MRAILLLWLVTGVTAEATSAQRARQGILTLEDARLSYEVMGSGDPIFVVHGGPLLDHEYLQPGLDALGRTNTLIYHDQRGMGLSTGDLDSSTINVGALADDIDMLRQVLGYQQISLLTHSSGIFIGLEYASTYRENVRTLILMNPIDPGTEYRDQEAVRLRAARTPEDSTELANLRASEGFEARDPGTLSQVNRVLFRQLLRDRARVPELSLDLVEATARNGEDVHRLMEASRGEVDWWGRVSEIDVPTLVIHGRYDVVPAGVSRNLAEALPQGRLTVVNSGHFPYLEDLDGLQSAVSGFFVELSR